ncbi:MAG: hypothetical protein NXI24_09670 [bacterium]|nr:hypothetical protein [bacterium]
MSFTLKIEPEWNIIKKIKEFINSEPRILAQGEDYREATLLTAIELVENGLKYSEGEPPQSVTFQFEIIDDVVTIEVHNSTTNPEHKAALAETLDKIKASNPFDLYVERLERIRDNPDGHSRMGLVRIAYEGEFELECVPSDSDIIQIKARRPLAASE